jgi:hypothetical protein
VWGAVGKGGWGRVGRGRADRDREVAISDGCATPTRDSGITH